ncbi:hypothetical protein JN531_012645 [Flagellatimonas centrodinii]|uniref:hypothetical protein n=1 Tax=Flagellatimonas centrodinii TaxID=2806210 RepID=UPI001FEF8737|nr:hypothetical protein [Flagellatimonas centrodinii]ULQ45948.1 hypothetical protein JN531_012645 [Flagellatimonas centrodinii]
MKATVQNSQVYSNPLFTLAGSDRATARNSGYRYEAARRLATQVIRAEWRRNPRRAAANEMQYAVAKRKALDKRRARNKMARRSRRAQRA